ncbi:kinase [Thraustotheca clavata]|uniref:Kinase n=1 Tax=Thraustotheca clavata TaxID=74557 RepID=A0A1V9YZ21_9STRA|nr:kinase [Thraustotheca clavata]
MIAILSAIGMVSSGNYLYRPRNVAVNDSTYSDGFFIPFTIPTACRMLSLLSIAFIIAAYMLKPSIRFNSIPLVLPLMMSQGIYLISRLYVVIAKAFDSHNVFRLGPALFWYCGKVSSIVTTTMNLCQIGLTVVITYRVCRSVGAKAELIVDTNRAERKSRWELFVVLLLSLAIAITVTLNTVPGTDEDDASWRELIPNGTHVQTSRYSPWTCMSTETQTVNNLYAPFVGLAVVAIFSVRIKRKVKTLYPKHARRSIRSVANYYIALYVLTWGSSLFVYAILIVLEQTPEWTPLYGPPNDQDKQRIRQNMRIALVFVPYDLQGFLTCIVTVWSYFRIRWKFDLGLPLKAISPQTIEFADPLVVLGQGAFAIVVKATWYPSRKAEAWYTNYFQRHEKLPLYNDGIPVAVKTFRFERESNLNGVQEEAYLASQLVHPNVMATYGCFTSGSNLYLVCEYLGGGTLQDVIEAGVPLPYEQVLCYALMIASGMEFLHGLEVPVIHRDLKPLNCCFDQSHVLKIVDFGLSRLFHQDEVERKLDSSDGTPRHDRRSSLIHTTFSASRSNLISFLGNHSDCPNLTMTSHVGTVCWAAPEVLVDEELSSYSLKVDVYSFAIICWQLYTLKQPFDDIPGSTLAVEEAVVKGVRPLIPEECPVHFAKLMRFAWHPNPHRRPSFHYIVRVLKAELEQLQQGNCRSESEY